MTGGGGAVVAIGVFDGLHLGHLAILDRARARAVESEAACVVVSFDPHPDVVLKPGEFRYPAPLTPLQEKRSRLLALGVDELRVIPFTRELAALEPETFVDLHLVAPHHPVAVVVGAGFALGRARTGTVERLREIGRDRGFEVEAVPLRTLDGAPISSTRIRGLLAQGKVAEVGRLLGRHYSLEGTVVTGHGIGRTLGFPTANLRLHEEKLLPRDGIYAGRARVGSDAGGEWRPAAVSVGTRPTFDGKDRTLEAFLLDWSSDLVGAALAVELTDWIRPEVRFDSIAELVAAMERDVAEVRRRFAASLPERSRS